MLKSRVSLRDPRHPDVTCTSPRHGGCSLCGQPVDDPVHAPTTPAGRSPAGTSAAATSRPLTSVLYMKEKTYLASGTYCGRSPGHLRGRWSARAQVRRRSRTRRVLAPVAHQAAKSAIVGDDVGSAAEETGPLFVVQRPGDDDLYQRVMVDAGATELVLQSQHRPHRSSACGQAHNRPLPSYEPPPSQSAAPSVTTCA